MMVFGCFVNGLMYVIVTIRSWRERARKRQLKEYSKGMTRRIGLAQALISDPEILFLDEPTDGIDPVGRREIHDILKELKNRGKTIFINSHMLAEIESVCDSVAILKKGQLAKIGTVEDITTDKNKVLIHVDFPNDLFNSVMSESQFQFFEEGNDTYSFQINETEKLNELIDYMRGKDIMIKSIFNSKSTLEDSFIDVVKGEES